MKPAMKGGTLMLSRDPDLVRELAHLDFERTRPGRCGSPPGRAPTTGSAAAGRAVIRKGGDESQLGVHVQR